MKKKLWIILVFVMVISMLLSGCDSGPEDLMTEEPSSEVTVPADTGSGEDEETTDIEVISVEPARAEPIDPHQPPELIVVSDDGNVNAQLGTYSWEWDNGDGTKTCICSDSSHPLDWNMEPFITSNGTVELDFGVWPEELTVRCWPEAERGNPSAEAEAVALNGNTLELKPGGYVYELIASWEQGTGYYGFYADFSDHSHSLASQPQTVDEPVDGYCGNTLTTVRLNGEEYTFMGTNSVSLIHILGNLRYDPLKTCKCLPEFEVVLESGKAYGISLTEGYARCADGQADLTEEQVETIRKILNDLE